RLAVAAVLTLTTPGTPMLFMGEEWGASTPWPFFTSHPEEWLGEAVRKGRTEEFARMGWDESVVPDPQSPATFASAKLDWTEQTHGAHARLLALYRALADLRRARAELTDPAFADLTAEDLDPDAPPAARRFLLGRGALRIAVNLSADAWPLALEPGETVLLTSGADAAASADGTVTVAPDTAVIVGPPLR
ncbi:MAG: malto-oligosyltrehalose trehalohydrolase, partial [Microbacterium sp.]|nr:malto-oligosyltrehalose trehalohydrolase [Microbacterium sp.]